MNSRLQLLLRLALALVPLPVLWFVALEPYLTLQRLVPAQAVLHTAYEKIYNSELRKGATWLGTQIGISYEFRGTPFERLARLEVGDESGMSESDVRQELATLQPSIGKTIIVWIDASKPEDAYLYRRIRSVRALISIGIAFAYWTWILFFRLPFVAKAPPKAS